MRSVLATPEVSEVTLFKDGFGVRSLGRDPETGDQIERLTFSQELDESDFFAKVLGERVSRLGSARHASYARVRRVDRPAQGALVLISDRISGVRLADLLKTAAKGQHPVDISATVSLLRQLMTAAALFSRNQRDLAIGNIGPERLLVTSQGRLVITEHLLGSAIESLQYSRERYWRSLRVATPANDPGADGLHRITPRTDVCGIGVVALSLLLGRSLERDEYPQRLPALLAELKEHSDGHSQPLSDSLKGWLARALQMDGYEPLQSPRDAQMAFESVLATERGYVTSSSALEAWLARHDQPADLGATAARSTAGSGLVSSEPPAPPSASTPAAAILDAASVAPASAASGATVPAAATPAALAPASPASAVSASAAALAEPPRPAASNETSPALTSREVELGLPAATPPPAGWSKLTLGLAALCVLQAVVVAVLWTRAPRAAGGTDGELVVQSRPASARVSIDGEDRGVTPLTLPLSPGAHVLEVRVGRSEPRVIPLTIQAGVQTAQYVELQSVPTTGGLEVRSEPAGAKVIVRGQARGTTPVVLKDLPPGDHEVVVQGSSGREVKQTVRVEAGVTAQLIVPLPR